MQPQEVQQQLKQQQQAAQQQQQQPGSKGVPQGTAAAEVREDQQPQPLEPSPQQLLDPVGHQEGAAEVVQQEQKQAVDVDSILRQGKQQRQHGWQVCNHTSKGPCACR